MDYEIDIEEHDVLDNPAIKKIFPDISVIKKEITRYFEEEPSLKEESDVAGTQHRQFCDADSDDLQSNSCGSNFQNLTSVETQLQTTFKNVKSQPLKSNKIILGSKPIPVTQDKDKKLNLGSTHKTVTNDENNKLILGTKPNTCTDDDNRNNILNSTQNEINKKLILGSKPNTFTNDIKIGDSKRTHEEKIKLKHMKLILQDIKSYLNQNGRYCKLCCRLFLSKNALDVHKNKVHRNKVHKNKTISSKLNTIKSRSKCIICGSYFSNNGNLFRHYRNIHQKIIKFKGKDIKTTVSEKVRNPKSQKSSRTVLVNKINAMKIKDEKKQITSKKINKSAHKCIICNMTFSTYGSLKRHSDRKHATRFKLEAKENDSISKENNDVTRGKEKRSTRAIRHFGTASAIEKYKNISIREKLMPISADKAHENKLKAATKKIQMVATIKKSQKKLKSASKKTEMVPTVQESLHDATSRFVGKSREVGSVEEDTKPKYVTRATNILRKHSNICQHCKKVFPDKKSLIEHMYEILEPKKNSSGGSINNASDMTKTEEDKILLVCRQCSYYFPSTTSFFAHMTRNHKTKRFLEVKKEEFDPQCKYCPYKSSSIATHNKHIHSYHIDLMFLRVEDELENDKNKQIRNNEKFHMNAISEFKSFALQSVLFKCNKCSICFLSSNIARDHQQHMEMLNNWKCSICNHILKEEDKEMHLKQHSFSQPFKVHNLSENAISNVLYNCTKCAIHFTEKRYQEHYPNCGSDTTDSSYCNICDILIDKLEMIHHKTQHEHLREISDFTIIDSDIIVDTGTTLKRKGSDIESEVRPIKRLYEQHNCLTYCDTCKSFLSYSGLKNKSHIKRTCSHLPTYACTVCGLVFTSSTLKIHKERHEKDKNFRLQDYKFFNLQGIQVLPPIPIYPKCKICKIHFLRKNAIWRHICDETDFLTCDICNIKLSERTYKLHMSFHFYVLRKTPFHNDSGSAHQTPEILKEFESKTQIISKTFTIPQEEFNRQSKSKPAEVKPSANEVEMVDQEQNSIDQVKEQNINMEQLPNDDSLVVLYTCKTCGVTVDSYDEVIKHCQGHYSSKENKITSLKKCKLCLLKFDSRSYLDHERNVHSNVAKIQVVKFDPSYFTSKNMIWVKHIFQTLPEEMVKDILKNSIYQHEHRIKLECIQTGSSPLYVYKCDSCGNFIDPGCVYKHAENPCSKVRKHPCSLCGLPYISIFSRNNHEKLHKTMRGLTKKSLNIILFNQSKDKKFNERIFRTSIEYLLYQCRNCHRVVEKPMLTDHVCDANILVKCITCGLLISKDDFKAHLTKHTDLGNFCSENFKVILFGRKDSNDINKDTFKKLLPCFSGTVYDYTLYKCQICEMCLKNNENIEKHTCMPNFDLDRTMCSECDLYFFTGNLRFHKKQHRTDPDFVKENINVISFNDNSSKTNKSFSFPKTRNNKTTQMKKNQIAKVVNIDDDKEDDFNASEETDVNSSSDTCVDIKKSNEHYITEKSNKTDVDDSQNGNDELSTEMATKTYADEYKKKCNVIENDEINYDDKEKSIVNNNENGVHDGESLDNSNRKMNVKDNDGQDKGVANGMDVNVDEEIGTLYKCKCGLHFLNKPKVTEHVMKCQPKAKQHKQNCSKCHLLFNPSELFSHLVVHHRDKTQVNNYKVIEISIDGQEKVISNQ